MEDLILDMNKKAKKERIANKNYEEIPLRFQQRKAPESKDKMSETVISKRSETAISIAKNLIQPRPSDAFQDLMKGIFDMNKRIDEKYSKKNIEDQQKIQDQPKSEKKEQKPKQPELNRWGAKIDQIEEKNQDIHSKQEIGIGTSAKYLDPAIPIRVISPEGSRIIVGPDNSRIVFPPQIVQVRPLSSPKPIPMQRYPIYEPSHSRIIVRQPSSPTRIVSYPIGRQNFAPPAQVEARSVINRVISQPVPPPTYPVHQLGYSQNSYPLVSAPVYQQPQYQQVHYQQPPQYYHPQSQPQNNVHMVYQNPNQVSGQFQQHYQIRPISQPQAITQKQPKLSKTLPNQQQKQQKSSGTTAAPSSNTVTPINNNTGTPLTAQLYQKMIQQHSQQYSTQNQQMMKMLAQMTQGQKQQYLNQKLLAEQLKKHGTQVNVKNIINQKQVTQISKIQEKNIVNKENISNIQNVMNQQNTMNMFNQANMLNYMQNVNNTNNQNNIAALQNYKQLFIGPNEQPIAIQGDRNPLQPVVSNKRISSKQIPITSSRKILGPTPAPRISPEQQLLNQKVQSQMFNQLINAGLDDLQKQGDYINVSGQLSDLNDIKTQNTRDGAIILRKMDTILNKYGTPSTKAKEIDEITQKNKNVEPPLFDSIIDKVNNISSQLFQKPESPKRAPIFESRVDTYATKRQPLSEPVPVIKQQQKKIDPPVPSKQNKIIEEYPQPDILFSDSDIAPVTTAQPNATGSLGPNRLSKQRLSLTKDMTFDFYDSK